jgi:hypothetical protein
VFDSPAINGQYISFYYPRNLGFPISDLNGNEHLTNLEIVKFVHVYVQLHEYLYKKVQHQAKGPIGVSRPQKHLYIRPTSDRELPIVGDHC